MNSISAKCGHVKRRLLRGERLTGPVLDFALSILPAEDDGSKAAALLVGIAQKLKAGTALTDYECHVMVDSVLLHVRLAGAAARGESKPTSRL